MPRKFTPWKGVEVFEYAPSYRTVTIDYVQYYLYFPYVVFVLRKNHEQLEHFAPNLRRTIHVGFRTEPLDEGKPLDGQMLSHPFLPQTYGRWLLSCSAADIGGYWNSSFGPDSYWPSHYLLPDSGLKNYNDWSLLSKTSPELVMAAFQDYPKTRIYYDSNTFYLSNSTNFRATPVELTVPLSETLEEVDATVLKHVFSVNAR